MIRAKILKGPHAGKIGQVLRVTTYERLDGLFDPIPDLSYCSALIRSADIIQLVTVFLPDTDANDYFASDVEFEK